MHDAAAAHLCLSIFSAAGCLSTAESVDRLQTDAVAAPLRGRDESLLPQDWRKPAILPQDSLCSKFEPKKCVLVLGFPAACYTPAGFETGQQSVNPVMNV